MTDERQVKTAAQSPTLPARPIPEAAPPLSPARAFVVQFREETVGAGNSFTGRVEHMTTGHAARFQSPQELLAFLVRVLDAVQPKKEQ
jgi:hypothetical protein